MGLDGYTNWIKFKRDSFTIEQVLDDGYAVIGLDEEWIICIAI